MRVPTMPGPEAGAPCVSPSIPPAATCSPPSSPARSPITSMPLRLIGEDLEVRPAQYVPLDIKLKLCADPHYWRDDLTRHPGDRVLRRLHAGRSPGFLQSRSDGPSASRSTPARSSAGRCRSPGSSACCRCRCAGGIRAPAAGLVTITLTPDMLPEALVEKIPDRAVRDRRGAQRPDRLEAGRIAVRHPGGPAMSCQHECEQPPVFPQAIFNRPGLDSIAYRIGSYADMRELHAGPARRTNRRSRA